MVRPCVGGGVPAWHPSSDPFSFPNSVFFSSLSPPFIRIIILSSVNNLSSCYILSLYSLCFSISGIPLAPSLPCQFYPTPLSLHSSSSLFPYPLGAPLTSPICFPLHLFHSSTNPFPSLSHLDFSAYRWQIQFNSPFPNPLKTFSLTNNADLRIPRLLSRISTDTDPSYSDKPDHIFNEPFEKWW